MEESQVKNLWDYNAGCFYDQSYKTRTSVIPGFLCPSQQHDSLLTRGAKPADGHSHSDDQPEGGAWEGSIADYRAVAGSSCPTLIPLLGTTAHPLDMNNMFAYLADGATPQPNPAASAGYFVKTTTPNNRGIKSWKARTGLKDIIDGTSKTLLAGEVGRGTSEIGHAFNGDHQFAVLIGLQKWTLSERPSLPPNPDCTTGQAPPGGTDCQGTRDFGDSGFGSVHPGIILFVMCDGSVQNISQSIEPLVLDAMASRAGSETFDLASG